MESSRSKSLSRDFSNFIRSSFTNNWRFNGRSRSLEGSRIHLHNYLLAGSPWQTVAHRFTALSPSSSSSSLDSFLSWLFNVLFHLASSSSSSSLVHVRILHFVFHFVSIFLIRINVTVLVNFIHCFAIVIQFIQIGK